MKINYTQIWRVMRITLFLLTAILVQVYATSHAQISLHETNTSLRQVIKSLAKQTGFDFVYADQDLRLAKPIHVALNDVNLEQALAACFEGQPLTYLIEDNTVLVRRRDSSKPHPTANELEYPLLVLAFSEVHGRVVDSTGRPLSGASIRVVDVQENRTAMQTQTDRNGQFILRNVPERSALEISYIGYVTREINTRSDMGTIVLQVEASAIQEVEINAGYYTVKDRERTGSISRVTATEIKNQPVTNPLNALIGRMPGVNVVQSSGVPGGGVSVEIRGRNSITGSMQPLYIIDGVPFSNEGMGSNSVGFILGTSTPSTGIFMRGLSPMVGINSADIETIEVLKDADATAIYGSRGANGVVLITTKRFKKDQSQFSVRYTQGMGKMAARYDLMNTEQYLELRRESYVNSGLAIPATAYDVNGTWDSGRYTDWQEELSGGTAVQNNLQASIQGGNERTNFVLSGGTFRETMVFPGDYANRKYSTRSVVNHRSASGRFQALANINLMVDKNDFPGVDLNYYAIRMAPNAPALYDAEGKLNWENNTWDNPMAQMQQDYRSKFENLGINMHLSQEIFKGLSLSARGGITYGWMNEDRTKPHTVLNPVYGIGPESSSIELSTTKRESWIIEPQLTYTKNWNDGLEINALVGGTFQANAETFLEQMAFGYTSNALIYDIKSASNLLINGNHEAEYRYSALFGRFNLGWKNRYFVNLTGRRDGSSRFGPGNQFANFGAVGAAWVFYDKVFAQNRIPLLSYGKLRGSYGLTGSDNIGDYKYLDTYASSTVIYEDKTGLAPTGLFNPNFAWETNSKIEGALELSFLNDRLSVITSYYLNRSSNQLVGIPLPAVTGFSSIHANLGATVQNTGLEWEVNTKNWMSDRFRWTSNFSLTVPKNKLVSFPNLETSTYATQYVVGQPLNISKRYRMLGVDPQTGIYQFEDINGDGRYTVADRQSIMSYDPTFYGGLNNSISWGGFQFDLFFQFVKQLGRNYLYTFSGLPGMSFNGPVALMDRWQKPGDIANIQRMATPSDAAAITANSLLWSSTAMVSDASFIRLKNLNVSYRLPATWMKGFQTSVMIQGQNLWTITRYNGADPATNATANASIAPLRMWTMGVQLNF